MTLEEKKLETLYKLLEEMEKKNRQEEVIALRWAIFTLEQK